MKNLKKYSGMVHLILLFVASLWIIWQMSLRKTVHAIHSIGLLDEQIDQMAVGGGDVADTNRMVVDSNILVSGELLNRIAPVSVERYSPYITAQVNGVKVVTAEAVIAGDYISMVRLIEKLECDVDECKVVSTTFSTVNIRERPDIYLNCLIVVQQITKR